MRKEEESIEEIALEDEDLLNFEFDDLSTEESAKAKGDASYEEEIIDLTDIVEEGAATEAMSAAEVAEPSEEQESFEVELGVGGDEEETAREAAEESKVEMKFSEEDIESELLLDEIDVGEGPSDSDLEKMLEESATQSLNLDVEPALDEFGVSEDKVEDSEALDQRPEVLVGRQAPGEITMQLDSLLGGDEAQEEMLGEADLEGLDVEASEELAAEELEEELHREDLGEDLTAEADEEAELTISEDELTAPVEELEERPTEPEAAQLELAGISEERMEAMITRVVQDTVQSALQDSFALSQERIEATVTTAVQDVVQGVVQNVVQEVVPSVVQEVVEKVTRETMATVAESVITKAIDNLREGLEIPSD